MAPRTTRLGGFRPLALAVVVATALLAPAGLSAQAAGDDPASPPIDPAVDPNPGGASESTVPLAAPPSAPQTSAPAAPPSTVTVARASASASESVSIVDFSFNPGTVTMNTGDTVLWTNNGEVPEGHDVTGDGLDSGLLKSGDSYSHTFNSGGTFSYICTIHPSMKGAVKVLARSSGSSGGKAGSEGSGGSGSGSGSSGAASAGTGSESAVVSSPEAGGSTGSLPATGSNLLVLVTLGLVLLNLGLVLRVAGPLRARTHR